MVRLGILSAIAVASFSFPAISLADGNAIPAPCPGIFAKLANWFSLGRKQPVALAPDLNGVDLFQLLREKNRFLQQNAPYLRADTCGGTCVSVSTVNNMLILAEAKLPGSISKLSTRRLKKLHQQLMDELLAELKAQHGIDGTDGAYLSTVDGIYSTVFRRVFNADLGKEISARELGANGFQSINPGPNSLLILAVKTEHSQHAIVVTDIKRVPTRRTREHNFPEEFIVTVSDPHSPGKFKELKVYEAGNRLYLEGYGDGAKLKIDAMDKRFEVTAGEITNSVVINLEKPRPAKIWTNEKIKAMLEASGIASFKADVTLTDGTRLQDITILYSQSDDHLFFYDRFILKSSIPLDEVADIVPTAAPRPAR